MFCVFLCGSDQLYAVFCIHLILLLDKMANKQTFNLHCPKIVPPISNASGQTPVFQTVELIVLFENT